jgi:hypothetical protein
MVGVRRLLAVAVAGSAVAAAGVYVNLPASQWLPDLAVGVAAVAVAVMTWRSSAAVSVLALAMALAWWVGTIWPQALYWHRGVLIQLVLSLPRAWPRSRVAGAVVVAGYVASLIPPVWRSEWFVMAAAVGVLVGGVMEARARQRAGFVVAPLLLGLAMSGGVLVPSLEGDEAAALPTLVGYDVLLVLVLVVVARLVRVPTRAELTDLAVDLGRAPVRDASTLGQLVRAEPGLDVDRTIQAALTEASRLESGNEHVREEVRTALVSVAESRRRLVVAAATERARLAEELERTIADPLRALAAEAHESVAGVPGLERAIEGLDAAVAGLRPPGLAAGLVGALREHPLIATLNVTLVAIGGRCDDAVEDTLYAVAAEGLTNVAKYAGPCGVIVQYDTAGPVASLEVSDDGVGGAVPANGSGLTGLADRVEALGGSLVVSSDAGVGTRLMASVPRAVKEAGPRPP